MALRQATERMTLDVSRLEVQTSLAVTQGDTMRRWEIKLTDRGRPIEIDSRWTAVLAGIKPDNNEIYNGCTVQDGWIIYDFATGAEIATAVGAYEIVIEVYDEEGGLLHSPKIWLTVIKGRKNISSEGQFTALQEIIRRLDEAEQEVDEVALENEKQDEEIGKIKGNINTLDGNKVPTTRTVNKKPLSADINLTASDVGAAPDGFGLGNTGVYLDDFNAMVGSGFYYTDVNTKNRMKFCPECGAILVVNGNKVGRQYKLLLGKNYDVGLLCIYYTNDYGSTWTVEWINPPMVDGVEYRTTERFLGQSVYTMLRQIGGFTGNGTCTLGSTGYYAVVRVCATANYGGVCLKVDDSKIKTIQHSAGYVYVQVSMGSETCTDCYVQMWYTK